MSEAKTIIREMNLDLRKQPSEKMMMFRIYIVMGDDGLPVTMAGEWCLPRLDRHLTVAWLPNYPQREDGLIPGVMIGAMLWNNLMSTKNVEMHGFMSAFMLGIDFIRAINEYQTV